MKRASDPSGYSPAVHCPDQDLLLALDGELAPERGEAVQRHLAACWSCRVRSAELERAIGAYVKHHRSEAPPLPSPDGPRALLKARMAEIAGNPAPWHQSLPLRAGACAVAALLALILVWPRTPSPDIAVAVPDPSLTPGATVLVSESDVCREPADKNKEVPAYLRKRVFEEYGIANSEPRDYELDYLITPALGGADDIHNLWPHSHRNTDWNARVKDALEDHLRTLVCTGAVDLATAQREIATNWIAAYKKYFATDRPIRN